MEARPGVVLQGHRDGRAVHLHAASKNGRRAVGNLLLTTTGCARRTLTSFRLSDWARAALDKDEVGFVHNPVFVVVGRAPRELDGQPDTGIGTYLNDSITHRRGRMMEHYDTEDECKAALWQPRSPVSVTARTLTS